MRSQLLYSTFIFLLLAACASAEMTYPGAQWRETNIKYTWDRYSDDMCAFIPQCLVNPDGNVSLDNQTELWYAGDANAQQPKCINSNQYILDYYCINGDWASRTKLIALHMLKMAQDNSAGNFTIFCGPAEDALNRINYAVEGGDMVSALLSTCKRGIRDVGCINNVCVLKTPSLVAVGASMNNESFKVNFLNALNASNPSTACNSLPPNVFTECASTLKGKVYYNPSIQAIIHAQSRPADFNFQDFVNAWFVAPMAKILNYVSSRISQGISFGYFNNTGLFNNIYIAKDTPREIFGFVERQQTNQSLDYMGVKFTNIYLKDPCTTLFKTYDSSVYCENQNAESNMTVVAVASDLVDAFKEVTAKLRP